MARQPDNSDDLTHPPLVTDSPTSHNYLFDPARHVEPTEIIYPGIVSREDLVLWVGREKHRKSNLLQQLTCCAALGRDFLNFRFSASRPLKVFYLDYEGKTDKIKYRLDRIHESMGCSTAEKQTIWGNLTILEARRAARAGTPIPQFEDPTDSNMPDFWRNLPRVHPADLYILDPLRSVHSGRENDSLIEKMLTRLRGIFGKAAVIVSHHMTKQSNGKPVLLADDMRLWSSGARGSGAMKATADVIVCQERLLSPESREEIHFGAFSRDFEDVGPIILEETTEGSFFFRPSSTPPSHLGRSLEILQNLRPLRKSAAVKVLETHGVKTSTAYRHIEKLLQFRFLRTEGELLVANPAPVAALDEESLAA